MREPIEKAVKFFLEVENFRHSLNRGGYNLVNDDCRMSIDFHQ